MADGGRLLLQYLEPSPAVDAASPARLRDHLVAALERLPVTDLALGWRLGDSAPWALAALVTLPLLVRMVAGPPVVVPAALAMLVITLAKRLEANRRPLPEPGSERRRVIVRRLLFDRDIASHREWLRRRPADEPDL